MSVTTSNNNSSARNLGSPSSSYRNIRSSGSARNLMSNNSTGSSARNVMSNTSAGGEVSVARGTAVDDEKVADLVEMGFDAEKVVAALKRHGNNKEQAVNDLLTSA